MLGAAVVAAAAGLAFAGEPSSGIFRLADPGHAAAPRADEVGDAHRPAGGLLSARWARGASFAMPKATTTNIADADEPAELLPEPKPSAHDREPALATATDAEPLRWVGPHETGTDELPALGPHGWLPIGIKPWGQRTPDRYRYVGLGEPLEGASWRNRPYAAGWFAGIVDGVPLTGEVDEHQGFFGGYRFGWDYDHYYGLETRIGGAAIGLSDPSGAVGNRTADLLVWDVNWVYYPWGDSRWRPFASFGLGIVNVDFTDQLNRRFVELLLIVLVARPVGVGPLNDYLALLK